MSGGLPPTADAYAKLKDTNICRLPCLIRTSIPAGEPFGWRCLPVPELDAKAALPDQKQFVHVIVVVPRESPLHFDQLDRVLAVRADPERLRPAGRA
jgi:hypothetical protein